MKLPKKGKEKFRSGVRRCGAEWKNLNNFNEIFYIFLV